MNIDIAFILLFFTIATGLVYVVDKILWASERRANAIKKPPLIIDYSRSFFPVLLIVLLIRSFIAQNYYVPTSSLAPTVLPGDFLFITQYSYGLRLPVWDTEILKTGKPKTGEIAVFHWPTNYKQPFVKRVIGTPGDHISYINRVLYINGTAAKQKFIGYTTLQDHPNGPRWKMKIMEENLQGVKHKIYRCADTNNCPTPTANFYNLVVPKGEYFMMGDNRDDSDDSRDWGFVPQSYFIGKAQFIWLSWNSKTHWIRWNQMGLGL